MVDREYTSGKLNVEVYPFQRSIINIEKKRVDLHIPMLRNPLIPPQSLPFDTLGEIQSRVNFVLYTNVHNIISPQQILNASYMLTEKSLEGLSKTAALDNLKILKNENFRTWESFKARVKELLPQEVYDKHIMNISIQAFPYRIETDTGLVNYFTFPTSPIDNIFYGFKKVEAKRSDAFLFANLADEVVKENKIKNIHRELFKKFDVVWLTQKGPKGKEIDKLLSPALKRAKETPEYKKLVNQATPPYTEWQHYEMGW